MPTVKPTQISSARVYLRQDPDGVWVRNYFEVIGDRVTEPAIIPRHARKFLNLDDNGQVQGIKRISELREIAPSIYFRSVGPMQACIEFVSGGGHATD